MPVPSSGSPSWQPSSWRFTGQVARGSWVLGVPAGLVAFLVLAPFAVGPRAFAENSLVRVLGLLSILIVALVVVVYFVSDVILWGVPAGYLVFLVLSLFGLGPIALGSNRESLLIVASVLLTVLVLSLVLAVYLILDIFLWQALLGSFVFLLLLGLNFQLLTFAKTSLVIVSGLLVTALVVEFTPAPGGSTAGGGGSNAGIGQLTEQVTGRGVSYRTDIWEASAGLIVNRPWFEYEELSLSFIRPLVGYGPEMFKYTFPLESHLGGLLSHAHNFWIHHAVEQGILGFFSSTGLFVAFFVCRGSPAMD